MSVKSDRWIREMATKHRMIEPFADRQVRARVAELLEMGGLAGKADRLVGELSHGDQRAATLHHCALNLLEFANPVPRDVRGRVGEYGQIQVACGGGKLAGHSFGSRAETGGSGRNPGREFLKGGRPEDVPV